MELTTPLCDGLEVTLEFPNSVFIIVPFYIFERRNFERIIRGKS